MRYLLLKRELYQLVIEGKKTTTLRNFGNYEIGQDLDFVCGRNIKTTVIVTNVRKIKLSEIDEEITKKEGFPTKESLIAYLEFQYPKNKEFTFIEFKLKQI